jgi:hypothetical protein
MHEPRVAMTPTPSTTALAETPARALMFLRAIATRAPLRALMSEGGFTAEDHAEGWALLGRACDYRAKSSPTTERFYACDFFAVETLDVHNSKQKKVL